MRKYMLVILFTFFSSFLIFGQGIAKSRGTVSDINGDPLFGVNAQIAVSDLNAAKLTQVVPYQSLSSLIQGKVPGVQITSSSGNLGGGFRFYMRSGGGLNGNEQPVIYVDGIRVDNADITGYGGGQTNSILLSGIRIDNIDISGFSVGGQTNNILLSLDPNNIAKIQIINGPAGAVMYGTSGSNGVVLITTKSGIGIN